MKIGTDIVNIARIEKLLVKYGEHFKEKFLTQEEIHNTSKIESIAGLWAAKEAISKALGCGIGAALTFHDISIAKTDKGTPYFMLSATAQKRHQIVDASLSISHDGGFAIAVVVLHTAEKSKSESSIRIF